MIATPTTALELLQVRLGELKAHPERQEAERAYMRAFTAGRWEEGWAFYRVAFPGVLELAEAEEVKL